MTLQVKICPETIEYLVYFWKTHGGVEEEELEPKKEVVCYT